MVHPPLLKQGHLESAAEDRIQATFEYIQGLGTPQPLWATCSSAQPASQKKKCFLVFSQTLLCFSLCLSPLVLSLGMTEKNLALVLFAYFLQLVKYIDKITLSLLLSRPNSSSSLSLTFIGEMLKFTFLGALCWTLSSMSIPLLYWGTLN